MPSWNIHTAHVESLLERGRAGALAAAAPTTGGAAPAAGGEALGANNAAPTTGGAIFGIGDENAFLFGNYVPDVHVGFMVPDVSYRIGYCITHFSLPDRVPVPDADRFWDTFMAMRPFDTPTAESLTLGYWAHLVADSFYNGRFRVFCSEHEMPDGELLRVGKQGDFDRFGRSLHISRLVEQTPQLVEAARGFFPFTILPEDLSRAIDKANAIVREGGALDIGKDGYQLLDAAWLDATFAACDERLAVWLSTWQELKARDLPRKAADIRKEAGLPPLYESAESPISDWRS